MPVQNYQEVELTIPAGAAISSAAKNVPGPIVAVYIPANWTAARLGIRWMGDGHYLCTSPNLRRGVGGRSRD